MEKEGKGPRKTNREKCSCHTPAAGLCVYLEHICCTAVNKWIFQSSQTLDINIFHLIPPTNRFNFLVLFRFHFLLSVKFEWPDKELTQLLSDFKYGLSARDVSEVTLSKGGALGKINLVFVVLKWN